MTRRLSIPLLAVTLLLGPLGATWGGIKPEPFRVQTLKLDNVAMALGNVSRMLNLLSQYHPPEPGLTNADTCPPPDPDTSSCVETTLPPGLFCSIDANNFAEELRMLAKHVQREEDAVFQVIGAQSTAPPNPCIANGLQNVRTAAMEIQDWINRILADSWDDKKVLNAVKKLGRNTLSLINVIDAYIPPGTTVTCVATPPNGSTISATDTVDWVVTVSPNPGPGQPIDVATFCGDFVGAGGGNTDSNGQLIQNNSTAALQCPFSAELRHRFYYEGESADCYWRVIVEQ